MIETIPLLYQTCFFVLMNPQTLNPGCLKHDIPTAGIDYIDYLVCLSVNHQLENIPVLLSHFREFGTLQE